jgi:hypothetical protein
MRSEFVVMVAAIRGMWPDAPEWGSATVDRYFADLKAYPAADVGDALDAYYRKGRSGPPNAGQLLALIDNRAEKLAAPKTYDGPGCQCHEVYFWECPAPESAHGSDYMKRRHAEVAVARAIATCVREGREIGQGEMAAHEHWMLACAQQENWYGCNSGYLVEGTPS